jgi:hypothetical protein
MSARIVIRPREYHGKQGFLVSHCNENSFATRIFVLTRAGAEIVKDALFLRAKADAAIDAVLREGR